MPQPKVNIAGSDGSLVGVTNGKLEVELGTSPTIDIGDVEIQGHSTIVSYQNNNVGTSAENLNGGSGVGGVGSASDSIACKHIDIMAAVANTGVIYVGGSGVTASIGIALYAGDVYSLDIDDVNNVFVLSTVDTENVQFTIYN
tara:strand:- start:1275 stop:1703 length:429 start_codon:yes stop_codon:yes gene_type:complete